MPSMMELLYRLESISVMQSVFINTYIVHGALLPLATHLNMASVWHLPLHAVLPRLAEVRSSA